MLNKDTFQTNPADYRLANQGVAKISFPPTPEALETLRGELSTFVCDGAYANGLSRILEAYLGSVGKGGSAPAVWISGFYGSGKSHLASMLASLWTNLEFPDGATAEGLIPHLPPEVSAPLKELRIAARRVGGVVAAGDTLGAGPTDPAEATLGIILRAVGLPSDIRAAQVALWLASIGILDAVRADLGQTFQTDIRNFILSPRFSAAVLRAKPELADNPRDLSAMMQAQFPEPPPVTVDLLETMGRQALLLGRKEIPLTLIVLDEVQQFIRQDPGLTLNIQTIAERLAGRFDGKVLLVATGQQALSDVQNLQKLLDRFPVQIALGEADVDAVIRKTVLRKKTGAEKDISAMLAANAGEISRHLRGSRLAHTVQDDDEAVLDWPLLPSRRRLWERILRELDRTGLGGTLRGQLRTTLDAAKTYGEKPLGNAVPVDFLYGRFATEAYNAGLLPGETRNRIEALKAGSAADQLKARVLMLVYMLGRIAPEADHHGVRAQPETIADLLVVDLSGDSELRQKVPALLQELRADGAVIEVSGEWRLQTKESAEWESAYRAEEKTSLSDQAGTARTRRDLLGQAIETALTGASSVTQGASKQPRRIHRLQPDDKAPSDGVTLRLRSGWDEDLTAVEKVIAASPTTDATVHLLIPRHRADELGRALVTRRAAEHVLQLRGVPQTDAGREAQSAMLSRSAKALSAANEILREAMTQARVVQAGGRVITGAPADAVKEAATNALARLYPQFADGDHSQWDKVRDRAMRKDPDAMKAVDHGGAPESHPVCKAILAYLGPGRKGSDIRSQFISTPYGWSQDVVDGALVVLANAGQVRVVGEDGKPASLPDIPRQKMGTCTYRAETTIITVAQRVAVRGLLTEAGMPFENGQEAFALSALLDRLQSAAQQSGGPAPSPEPDTVPELPRYKTLSGNDLLAALAENAVSLREKLKAWQAAASKANLRLPNWHLAERLVRLGADAQDSELSAMRTGRKLLVDPDPVPPLVSAAADTLREKLNAAHAAWDAAWKRGEDRLVNSETWGRLTPDQKRAIREDNRMLPVTKPTVDTPQAIAEALAQRGLSEWENMSKALPARVDDALAAAAALLEPKARTVNLPGVMMKSEAELDAWLAKVRAKIAEALGDGPVIPKV
ncbi:BREX system P-loop protein BrxC [Mesorhizobium sophorae]|uniref:BREX system P-loop protein BrxC n=1 Tax=Mesorhizobium sophorae TaxID=1300294 RepID=UPI000BA496FC|nr:BREX system P-loop protein BrxC [Mesorhizobium sophorae]